jgi:molybdenum cofactor biosynthesis enzyme
VNDRDLAAELQATKDDPDEWDDTAPGGDSVGAKRPKRRLAAMVSVRLSRAELEVLQSNATRRGETVSGYLRRLALEDAAQVTARSGLCHPLVSISQEVRVHTRIDQPRITTDGRWILTSAS